MQERSALVSQWRRTSRDAATRVSRSSGLSSLGTQRPKTLCIPRSADNILCVEPWQRPVLKEISSIDFRRSVSSSFCTETTLASEYDDLPLLSLSPRSVRPLQNLSCHSKTIVQQTFLALTRWKNLYVSISVIPAWAQNLIPARCSVRFDVDVFSVIEAGNTCRISNHLILFDFHPMVPTFSGYVQQ